MALRAAVERGDPFAQELSAAKALASDAAMLAPLEPFAATGVPRSAALARELSQVTTPMLNAAGPARESGILDRLQQNAERLVRIRPINEGAGDEPSAVVARAEVKAAHGDIAGALVEVARLPDAMRAPAQAWIARPKCRLRRWRPRGVLPKPRSTRSPRPANERAGREANMIRVVAFLILAGLAAAGAVWLADRPGEISVTWLGYRIDTSMMVALAALALIVVAAMIMWSAVRVLLRSPQVTAAALRERRERKGYEAISRGLIAIGAGDMRAALRHAGNAERNAPAEPLALLLRAQTAQLSGDRAAADAAFRAMAGREDMRLLGLRGLFVEAQRRADFGAAHGFAEQAVSASPAVGWADQALLEFRCGTGDWIGALAILENNRKSGVLDRDDISAPARGAAHRACLGRRRG